MDELEFESRLRARLHQRFDGAQPPPTLRAVPVAVVPARIRLLPRSASFAWLAVAVLVAALAAGLGFRAWTGPGGFGPSPSPSAFVPPSRSYLVMPAAGFIPTKAAISAANEVLTLRIRALGIGTFTSAAGDAITFELPADVDDALVREVLAATGELSFVPLPPEDYGDGKAQAVVGQPLPVAEPALFGRDQITSSGVATANGLPTSVHFELAPVGTAALDVYTTGNVGATFAVLVDGRVAMLPHVAAPITDGRLELSGPDASGIAFLAAMVTSGTLPETWRTPRIPEVIDAVRAGTIALAGASGSSVQSTQLTTVGTPGAGAGLMPAWLVTLVGAFPEVGCDPQMTPRTSRGPCETFDSALVTLNAEDGRIVVTQVPAP